MKLFTTLSLCFALQFSFAQTITPLVPNISVDSVKMVPPNVCRIAHDPISGNIFYATVDGNIFEVSIPAVGPATDTLRFTNADHGIPGIQGFCIYDSVMYVSGNTNSSTTSIGWVKRGKLNPNGTRTWSTVATTAPYPSASPTGDHAFSNVAVDPAGQYIYANCGARTHLGEIRDNNGAWPGLREVPMTTRLFRFGINETNVVLQNDSTWLDSSGYIYASGLRNPFDIAWDGAGEMFAIDNSGERDDSEELNWIRQGRHYGFPWNMGGYDNPIQYPGYIVDNDPMVNHNSIGYMNGWFVDTTGFPPIPVALLMTVPIRNLGPDADFFRDANGLMDNASDIGGYITSFSPHRSPLGLVFDRTNYLSGDFTGDGFLTSFMPGGDSSGYSPMSPWGGPVVPLDPSRDVLHIELTYNAGTDNYDMSVQRIAEGFWLPVDAVLIDSSLYVIESSNNAHIWRINFPHAPVGVENGVDKHSVKIYPNPSSGKFKIEFDHASTNKINIEIYSMLGEKVYADSNFDLQSTNEIDVSGFPKGIYVVKIQDGEENYAEKIIVE